MPTCTKTILNTLISLVIASGLYGQSPGDSVQLPQISTADLSKYVYTLAGPEMAGRNSGEPGLRRAKDFILEEFKKAGLEPAYEKSWQQWFYILKDTLGSTSIKVGKDKFLPYKDYVLHHLWEGYPRKDETLRFDGILPISLDTAQWHFSRKEIRNKILLLFPGTYGLSRKNHFHPLGPILIKAKKLGVQGMLIPTTIFDSLPTYAGADEINALMETIPHYHDVYPVVYIKWNMLQQIIGAEEMKEMIAAYNKKEFDYVSHFQFAKKVTLKFGHTNVKKAVSNLIGYIPGSEKVNEFVVLGAHYDHVGRSRVDTFFGADDNASGTAALLELAHIFGEQYRQGKRPLRTMVFIAFAAEEDGLLGSKVYVEYPPYSLDSTSAMLNMDMIGRRDGRKDDYIYAIGHDYISSDWRRLIFKALNNVNKFAIDISISKRNDPEYLISRSDQASFISKGVPALFFYDYMIKDYHLPSDTPDKIDYELLKKRTIYIYYLLNTIVNRPEMLRR